MDAEIVVELLSRIKALERDVAELKNKYSEMESHRGECIEETHFNNVMNSKRLVMVERNTRDTTRYAFNGGVYTKKGLVYAVVKNYVDGRPDITCAELKMVFDKSVQGSLGVVENVELAKRRGDAEYRVRYFTDENEILHLADGDMVVCTQWGIMNIPRFLTVAEQLGYQIKAI